MGSRVSRKSSLPRENGERKRPAEHVWADWPRGEASDQQLEQTIRTIFNLLSTKLGKKVMNAVQLDRQQIVDLDWLTCTERGERYEDHRNAFGGRRFVPRGIQRLQVHPASSNVPIADIDKANQADRSYSDYYCRLRTARIQRQHYQRGSDAPRVGEHDPAECSEQVRQPTLIRLPDETVKELALCSV